MHPWLPILNINGGIIMSNKDSNRWPSPSVFIILIFVFALVITFGCTWLDYNTDIKTKTETGILTDQYLCTDNFSGIGGTCDGCLMMDVGIHMFDHQNSNERVPTKNVTYYFANEYELRHDLQENCENPEIEITWKYVPPGIYRISSVDLLK